MTGPRRGAAARGRTALLRRAVRRGCGAPHGTSPGPTGQARPARRLRMVRAGSDALPASLRRLMARARRRPPRSALPWALLAVLATVAVLVVWTLWGSSLLGVREVHVTGTGILSAAQVRQAAEVPEGIPLMRVDRAAVAGRVAALPPVAEVRVDREWPHRLVITVVERTPVAVLPADEAFALIDATGAPFHTVASQPPDLPVLILTYPGADGPATRAALTVLAALAEPLRSALDTVTVAGPASIQLTLRDGRQIIWGDEADSEFKAQVATALLNDPENTIEGDIIDVSAPDVVSIR